MQPYPSFPNIPDPTLRDDDDTTSTPSDIALVSTVVSTVPDAGIAPTVVTDISASEDTAAVIDSSIMTVNTVSPEEVHSTSSRTLSDPLMLPSLAPVSDLEGDRSSIGTTDLSSNAAGFEVSLIRECSWDASTSRPIPSSMTPQAPSPPSAS